MKYPKRCGVSRSAHRASCTWLCSRETSVPCACVSEERRTDGRTDGNSCCAAVLIKTCSPHNVSTPAPNTTRALSHIHTRNVKRLLQKKHYVFILPINVKYDTHIVNSTDKEEETEKIPFNEKEEDLKDEGGGYGDIERPRRRQRALATPGNVASVVSRAKSKNITLYLSFWATSLMGASLLNGQ